MKKLVCNSLDRVIKKVSVVGSVTVQFTMCGASEASHKGDLLMCFIAANNPIQNVQVTEYFYATTDLKEDITVYLDTKELTTAVSLLSRKGGDITVQLEENTVILSVGESVIKLGTKEACTMNGQDLSEQPLAKIVTKTGDFLEALKYAGGYSTDKYTQTKGIFFGLEEDQMSVITTNGNIIAKHVLKADIQKSDSVKGVHVVKWIDNISKILENEDMVILVLEGNIIIQSNCTFIFCGVLSETFLDTEKLCDVNTLEFTAEIKVAKEELVTAIDLVSLCKKDANIRIAANDGKLMMYNKTGEGTTVLDCKFDGEIPETKLIAATVRESVTALSGKELTIKYINPVHPFVIYDSEDLSNYHILMPSNR